MNTKPSKLRAFLNRTFRLLACLAAAFGLSVFMWYGVTRICVREESNIPENNLQVSDGETVCQLRIPRGTLSLTYPRRSAVGAASPFRADIHWSDAVELTDCTGPEADWKLELEARPAIIGSELEPVPNIRQPLSGRTDLRYEWKSTAEAPQPRSDARFWLRLIVSSGETTLERWDLLVRDFQTESLSFLGLTAPYALAYGLASLLAGILIWIIVKK